MYYIYHVPGIKIGCGTNAANRTKAQGFDNYEILEEHEDIYVASERELELQKQYGYPVDNLPYYQAVANLELGKKSEEYQFKVSSAGGKAQKGIPKSKKHKRNLSIAAKNNRATCKYCGLESNKSNITRYHNDNCKKIAQ